MLLPVGASPAFALVGGAWASLFSLSGPCSRGCRAAWADAPSGGVRVSPVYLRSGRCWCCRVRVGNARSPVWGWCGFRACRRWGVGDDGIPRDCTRCGCSCGVSLYSSARCCSLGLRVCLSVRAWLCEWRVVVCACWVVCGAQAREVRVQRGFCTCCGRAVLRGFCGGDILLLSWLCPWLVARLQGRVFLSSGL